MSTSSPQARRLPCRRDDLLIADFDTELVVLVPDQRQAHRLDEGLSLVLASCDGTTLVDELLAEVAHGTGEDREATARWLDTCLERLHALGIFALNEADEPSEILRQAPPAI